MGSRERLRLVPVAIREDRAIGRPGAARVGQHGAAATGGNREHQPYQHSEYAGSEPR